MAENFELLTPDNVWSYIKYHFIGSEGIMAQIKNGLQIDETMLPVIGTAFHMLHQLWENKDFVRKEDIRLLWNIRPELEKYLLLFPQRRTEINELITYVGIWLDELFVTPSISEEHAIAIISQHIIGPSFIIEVFHSSEINEDSLEYFYSALDTLKQIWKNREYISKLGAGALINTQGLTSTVSGLYSEEEMRHLQKIEQQIMEHITEILE